MLNLFQRALAMTFRHLFNRYLDSGGIQNLKAISQMNRLKVLKIYFQHLNKLKVLTKQIRQLYMLKISTKQTWQSDKQKISTKAIWQMNLFLFLTSSETCQTLFLTNQSKVSYKTWLKTPEITLPGVNFTNVLRAAFTLVGPKSAKWHCWLDCLFCACGI